MRPLAPHVPMLYVHIIPDPPQALGDHERHRDGAVLSAGASEADGEIALSFAPVARQEVFQKIEEPGKKLLGNIYLRQAESYFYSDNFEESDRFLEKAQKKSSELMAHLETKAKESRKNPEHYKALMQNVEIMNQRMANLNASVTKETIEQEIGLIEAEIAPLTQQTPYTLLMMRVVEIGLPLLLSIFSVFFVFRYSLTEKRSHEIKELIRIRNEERDNDKETTSEIV